MKKFNEICGEMARNFVQIFKHFDGNFVLFSRQILDTFPITEVYSVHSSDTMQCNTVSFFRINNYV